MGSEIDERKNKEEMTTMRYNINKTKLWKIKKWKYSMHYIFIFSQVILTNLLTTKKRFYLANLMYQRTYLNKQIYKPNKRF